MSAPKQRFVYIDLLRGWAGLVMIEVHVVNAFLSTVYRDAAWFRVLNFINGLVAPAFLFVAGYSFVIVAQRKWDDYLAMNDVFRKQLQRIAQIWLVGYALHVPFFSLRRLVAADGNEWLPFWKVDVLHCIAVSLLILLLCVMIVRTRKRFFVATSVLAAAAIGLSPFFWGMDLDGVLPLQVLHYFSAARGAQFPLFPWAGFVFCGAVAGFGAIVWRSKEQESAFFRNVLIGGVAMIVLCLVGTSLPFDIYPPHNFWRASPLFFGIRLGIVMALLATLWYWEQTAKSRKSIVSVAGSESLVVYAFHLLAIYGLFFDHKSLSYMIGRTCDIPAVIGMTAALIALMVVLAYLWNTLKNRNIRWARYIQYSLLVAALSSFIFNPL
ncbi:MAG: heparan-alpha-glucosaminide N-acetyltransferase domain-containing protein [Ignavibacteriales bacterium]|nr:heparan-alpha-glucosaminide N-acetyltransferase domain-containing protein [Ignavibacteriales bacterium]